MNSAARVLTLLSIGAAALGVALWAVAGTCIAALPPSNVVAGWVALPGADKSGAMGERPSYDAYDGNVDVMKGAQGIRYFAQRTYRNANPTRRYLTVDVFQLSSVARAQALYSKYKKDDARAKPLTSLGKVKDQAFVASLSGVTVGYCQRGKYLCQVTLSKGMTDADRTLVKAYVSYLSRKLAP